MIPSITWKRWPSLFTDWQATSLQPPCPKAEQLLSICPNTRAGPRSHCSFSCFFSFLFVSINDRKRRVRSQQTNKRDYGSPIYCNQLLIFVRCWLFRKRSFPLPPSPFHPTPLYHTLAHTHMRMHTHACAHTHTHTYFPLCQGTAARQILTNTNGFWLLLGNPSILTWVDMLSKIQTLELSHQLFMWHRWRVAIRSQAMGLGDLRCCTVASGNFEKQYPEMGGKNPHWKCKFEVSQSVCLSVVWIKISLSLYVKALCVCIGCMQL